NELTLPPSADGGGEERLAREAAIAVHLGLMLVRQLQRVGAIGTGEAVLAAVPFDDVDELPPAAAITLHALDGDRIVRRQQPGIDERPDQPDGRRRITPRHGDEARGADRRRL